LHLTEGGGGRLHPGDTLGKERAGLVARHRDSHLYDGWLYHLVVDTALARARRLVRDQVRRGSALIDMGCGTGALLFSLADRCPDLVGVERSGRMCAYGRRRAEALGLGRIRFLQGDATRLHSLPEGSFDYASASMVLHEMEREKRLPLLSEMRRLARTLIILDYRVPLRAGLPGIFIHLIEGLAGRGHYRTFRSFVDLGGLAPLLMKQGLSVEDEVPLHGSSLHLLRVR
jgi:demethylmenaquinone methyltransferase/2-methoxy-6-polyprenyl-1,4-benzoquinol methylase